MAGKAVARTVESSDPMNTGSIIPMMISRASRCDRLFCA
jgi:hypothetical protein